MDHSNDELVCLAKEFRAALESRLADDASGEYRLPSKDEVAAFCRRYLEVLFPFFFPPGEPLSAKSAAVLENLDLQLGEQVIRAIRFDCGCRGRRIPVDIVRSAEGLVTAIRGKLPRLAQLLATDLEAALKNDPAANGLEEIMLSYQIGRAHV